MPFHGVLYRLRVAVDLHDNRGGPALTSAIIDIGGGVVGDIPPHLKLPALYRADLEPLHRFASSLLLAFWPLFCYSDGVSGGAAQSKDLCER